MTHGNPRPAISVLLAFHDCDRYLGAAIESVLKQSFNDFELLLLDDGSSDQSGAIAARFQAADARVRLIERPGGGNRGVSVSLNELLDVADGDFVARMDGDDICRPSRFAAQLAFLENHPEAVAVGCQCEVIDPGGKRVGVIRRPTTHDAIEHRFIHGGGGIMHPAAMIRIDRLRQIGGYDESLRYAQDLDVFLRLGEIGTLRNLDDDLLQYRWHPGQVSVQKRSQQLICVAAALVKAGRRRNVGFSEQLIEIHGELAWRLRLEGKRLCAFRHAARVVTLNPFRLLGWRYLATSMLGRRQDLESISVLPEGGEKVNA